MPFVKQNFRIPRFLNNDSFQHSEVRPHGPRSGFPNSDFCCFFYETGRSSAQRFLLL